MLLIYYRQIINTLMRRVLHDMELHKQKDLLIKPLIKELKSRCISVLFIV